MKIAFASFTFFRVFLCFRNIRVMSLKILIILTFFCFNANAQSYQPLPDSNAIWIVEQYSGGPQSNWYWIYFTESDTLINTTIYHKLYLFAVYSTSDINLVST